MSEKQTPPSKTPRTPAVALLSAAALLVVTISFVVLKKSGTHSSTPVGGNPESTEKSEAAGMAPAASNPGEIETGSANQAQKNPSLPGAPASGAVPTGVVPTVAVGGGAVTTEVAETPSAPPAQCWEGKFALKTARLSAIQKESLGERSQKIHLAELFEKLSVKKLNEAQLCVRAAGHAVAFEKDNKDPTSILVRGGSGRIHEKAALQISYCLKAENCSPCKVKKDSFEDALLGESEADAQANADEDVTSKLSAEVRRELARLEAESKPSAIDAWELEASNTRCGRG